MEVRAKKALGQHFLTDQKVARAIVDALEIPGQAGNDGVVLAGNDGAPSCPTPIGHPLPVLEVGPGMGVLTQYLMERKDIDLKLVEIDHESVEYLLTHFQDMQGRLMEADFLTLRLEKLFPSAFAVIGNFPTISLPRFSLRCWTIRTVSRR